MNVSYGDYAKVQHNIKGEIVEDIVRTDGRLSNTLYRGIVFIGERKKLTCFFRTDDVEINFGLLDDFKQNYPEYFI